MPYTTTNVPWNSGTAYPSQPPPTSNQGPDLGGVMKQCYNCGKTSTPLWRRDPSTQRTLCNACGLYLQQRQYQRPQALVDADDSEVEGSEESSGAPGGPECSHCHTHQTSVWRSNMDGDQVCNACGVYQRLRGKERPLTSRKSKITPRAKHSPSIPSSPQAQM
ncbi:hypothetical protein B0H13DRAFT_1667964 [Mycena leptocephala]|nr:hypothetical protein B0H13DRAFT_1667964 [Mycena leptocephala]